MSLPILSVAQMRAWENATWQSGQTEAAVIERVGRAVAKCALRMTQSGDFILLLAGKGHNGDDVRAALPHLKDRTTKLLDIKSAADDFAILNTALSENPALIVDGLFGLGLNRPLDDSWHTFIARINHARHPVLAVDVPSGLDADTGALASPGGTAIEAAVTLTVGAPKRGLLAPSAERFVGRLEVAENIGLGPLAETSEVIWTSPNDFSNYPPARPIAGHKSTFGHLAIIAGSVGYHGAAVLAARGAQRAQPGLISVFTHQPAYYVVASQLQAPMVKPWETNQKLTDFSGLLMGPGLAANDLPADMKQTGRRLWKDFPGPVVVDASALDWLPLDPAVRHPIRVITPHPGEAARLLKASSQQIQQNRLHAVREISKNFGHCWVVLKGHHTLIGRSTGEVFVNSSGNPHLAQGGSGDLLAGFIAGLLAQPALQSDIPTVLRYAVWQHGAAADALQSRRPHWVIEDLATEIGTARP